MAAMVLLYLGTHAAFFATCLARGGNGLQAIPLAIAAAAIWTLAVILAKRAAADFEQADEEDR